jgi:hypothetical protein
LLDIGSLNTAAGNGSFDCTADSPLLEELASTESEWEIEFLSTRTAEYALGRKAEHMLTDIAIQEPMELRKRGYWYVVDILILFKLRHGIMARHVDVRFRVTESRYEQREKQELYAQFRTE